VESAVLQVAYRIFYTVPLIKNETLMQGVEVSCTVHDITTDDLLEAFPVTEITPGYVMLNYDSLFTVNSPFNMSEPFQR
jgi:hypothetical protein